MSLRYVSPAGRLDASWIVVGQVWRILHSSNSHSSVICWGWRKDGVWGARRRLGPRGWSHNKTTQQSSREKPAIPVTIDNFYVMCHIVVLNFLWLLITSIFIYQQLAGYTNDKVTQTRFSLRSEMLPSYLPTRIAEKILFVGESIQIFESASDSRQRKQQGNAN